MREERLFYWTKTWEKQSKDIGDDQKEFYFPRLQENHWTLTSFNIIVTELPKKPGATECEIQRAISLMNHITKILL